VRPVRYPPSPETDRLGDLQPLPRSRIGIHHRSLAPFGERARDPPHPLPTLPAPLNRGKQERLNRFIRDRFILEAEAAGINDLAELNDRFGAWCEQVCNARVHAETHETPIARFLAGGDLTDPAKFDDHLSRSSVIASLPGTAPTPTPDPAGKDRSKATESRDRRSPHIRTLANNP
jgi:hypothetical protein